MSNLSWPGRRLYRSSDFEFLRNDVPWESHVAIGRSGSGLLQQPEPGNVVHRGPQSVFRQIIGRLYHRVRCGFDLGISAEYAVADADDASSRRRPLCC
jgi:hypothetical protein